MLSITTKPARAGSGAAASYVDRITAWFARRRIAPALVTTAAGAVLFLGYLRMSRTVPINADGASNAIQAWEMLHGNVLLTDWTVTDVSFYTTELIEYLLVELVYGYHGDVVHVAAALTYTLAVLLAAFVAKGRATGREAAARMAVAVAIMLVPGFLTGYTIVLGSPAHFGTSVPLLVTWLVLDRATSRPGAARPGAAPRWLPAAVAVLLAWGTVGDPLVMYIGALPLVVVSLVRIARGRRWPERGWRDLDLQLVLAGVASVVLARAFLAAVSLAGGFHVHPPIAEFAPLSRLGEHLWLLVQSLAVVFGAYFPDLPGPLSITVGVLKVAGILLVAAAVAVMTGQVLRRAGGADDRVGQVLACAVGVNVCAFVVSTLPVDLLTARQVAAVAPLGAAVAGRVIAPRLAALRLMPVVAVALVVSMCAFAVRSTDRPVPDTGADVGQWLESRKLTHGIGSYWGANVVTLTTSGRVTVAPTIGVGYQIMGYRWESRADWYDPQRNDARFLVIDLENPGYGTVDAALRQFGPPLEQHDFGRFTVLVYGHNLLVGLPAYCVPEVAARMADCP